MPEDLNNRVLMTTAISGMPEGILHSTTLGMDVDGITIRDSCFACEVPAEGEYAQVSIFASLNNITFINCNLCNVDQREWTNVTKINCNELRYRPRADRGYVDWLVNPDGSWGDGPLNP